MSTKFGTKTGYGLLMVVVAMLLVVSLLPRCSTSKDYNVYIPNAGDGTISVIDSATRRVEKTLKVGESASHGLGVTRDNRYVYVGDLDGGNVYVIDTQNDSIAETIALGERIHGIDISPGGKFVLVSRGRTGGPFLAVIDTTSNEVATIVSEQLQGPTHMSFSPDGKRAYVADPLAKAVVVVDMIKKKVEAVWPTGADGAQESRPSPDGKFLYVANYEGNTLSVIDTADGQIRRLIPAGEKTHAVGVSPDGRQVWVVASGTGEILVFDAHNDYDLVARFKPGPKPNHVTFHPRGKEAYVTDSKDNLLLIFHTASYEEVARIPVGVSPHEVDFMAR